MLRNGDESRGPTGMPHKHTPRAERRSEDPQAPEEVQRHPDNARNLAKKPKNSAKKTFTQIPHPSTRRTGPQLTLKRNLTPNN